MKGEMKNNMTFTSLIGSIRQIHDELAAQASRAVNVSLTLRNWLIGCYIEEYERSGVDRAEYGDKLMDRLAETLSEHGISRCDRRELYRYRQFYLKYPQIVEAVPPQSASLLGGAPIWQTLPTKGNSIGESPTPQFKTDGKTLVS